MSQLSQDLGIHAPPHRIVDDEVTYNFYHIGLSQLSAFEKERYRLEVEALRSLKDEYGKDEYLKRLDEIRCRYARQEFSFHSDPDFVKSPEGMSLLLRLILRDNSEQEITELLRRNRVEALRLIELVINESFPREPGEDDIPF